MHEHTEMPQNTDFNYTDSETVSRVDTAAFLLSV